MVRKRHCNISEALANVFALSPKPGAPIGVGAPGFSRSEPIVVTPLQYTGSEGITVYERILFSLEILRLV
jgi:hypothetical protein